jgi:hypothetical protein
VSSRWDDPHRADVEVSSASVLLLALACLAIFVIAALWLASLPPTRNGIDPFATTTTVELP